MQQPVELQSASSTSFNSIPSQNATKGDYTKVVMEDDEEKRGSISYAANTSKDGVNSSLLGNSVSVVPASLANHPALPVMCYCAASILMTVVNKVRENWNILLRL